MLIGGGRGTTGEVIFEEEDRMVMAEIDFEKQGVEYFVVVIKKIVTIYKFIIYILCFFLPPQITSHYLRIKNI